MSCTGRDAAASKGGAGWLPIAFALLAIALVSLRSAAPAQASEGYELSTSKPILVSGIEFTHGVAVDQIDHRVYIAVVTNDVFSGAAGEIRRFESDGTPAGTFVAGGPQAYFSGVAVNPITRGFYVSQVRVESPVGNFGTAQMIPFSSAGVAGTPFALSMNKTLPQIATDSSGYAYFPNAATNSVQVFDSAGVLQETITCGGCPGGDFGEPASVAIDSEDSLYVVDFAPDRVVKLTTSGGMYGFDSVLQSGRGAVAVGVDPSTDDVFVGDFPNGRDYHVVAYDSSGTQFDDFGAGLFINPPLGAIAAAQIAADATTHRLYLTETNKIYVFERVTIGPPSATVEPASGVGQLSATLNAKVNAEGHAVLECEFEYTDEADFLANGFTNASGVDCPENPDGSTDTAIARSVSGLSPSTAYRYRLTATNNGGSVTTGNRAFETLPVVPPDATTEPALSVTQTTAKITGKANPHGGSVSSCKFDLGTSPSYGGSFPCSPTPGAVTTDVAVSRNLTGLTPGMTYHYRLVVSTNAGTATGEDVEFTTSSPPTTPGPEPTLPSLPPSPPPPAEPVVVGNPPLECKKGFRPELTSYGDRCMRICRKGFRRKRVRGKVRCVRRVPPKKRRRVHSRG